MQVKSFKVILPHLNNIYFRETLRSQQKKRLTELIKPVILSGRLLCSKPFIGNVLQSVTKFAVVKTIFFFKIVLPDDQI